MMDFHNKCLDALLSRSEAIRTERKELLKGGYFFPQPLHSCFSYNPPLGEIKLSLHNFMYNVAFPNPPLHFDPNICTRTGLLNILILNLH